MVMQKLLFEPSRTSSSINRNLSMARPGQTSAESALSAAQSNITASG